VMEQLGTIFNQMLDPIFELFKLELFAPALAMVISLIGLAFVTYFAVDYFKKREQLKSFSGAFESFSGSDEFARHYELVAEKLNSRKINLVWGEYLETCIFPDLNDPRTPAGGLEIYNTFRPQEYFNLNSIFLPNAMTNALPNLFVGCGLVVTFMGLVAALATSADAITQITNNPAGGGQSTELIQPILELLRQASTKFYASFTALGFSLLIGLELRFFQFLLEMPLEEVNEKLEGLVRYSPLEKIATEQLEQSQQQTGQLRAFNTNLATQIGERVKEALSDSMGGVITQLGEISENLGASNIEALGKISKELVEQTRGAAEESLHTLANRMDAVSSGMRGLPSAMTGITDDLQKTINDTIDKAGDEAAANIKATGDVSRQLIEELLGGLDNSIKELTEASRESAMQLKNAAAGIDESVNALAASMQTGSEAAASKMVDGAQKATDAFSSAADNFRDTVVESGRQAAENAGRQIEKGAKDAVDNIADSLSTPLSILTASASSFSNDLSSLRDRMQLLTNSTASLAGVTQESGDAMSGAIQELKDVVNKSELIMSTLQEATQPLPEAIRSLMKENEARHQEYVSLLTEIRGFNEATSAQAQELKSSWEAHKTRFKQIDEGLIQAFDGVRGQLEQFVQSTQTTTNDIDKHLTNAVGTLGGFVEDLKDLLEDLKDLREDREPS